MKFENNRRKTVAFEKIKNGSCTESDFRGQCKYKEESA